MRKHPIAHRVKTHIREGRVVHAFNRGNGLKPKSHTNKKSPIDKKAELIKLLKSRLRSISAPYSLMAYNR